MVCHNDAIVFKVHNGSKKDGGNKQIDQHIIPELPFGGEGLNKTKKGPDKRDFGNYRFPGQQIAENDTPGQAAFEDKNNREKYEWFDQPPSNR
ncbi:hypothetical protein D3C85_1688060 [compost metagenome]